MLASVGLLARWYLSPLRVCLGERLRVLELALQHRWALDKLIGSSATVALALGASEGDEHLPLPPLVNRDRGSPIPPFPLW